MAVGAERAEVTRRGGHPQLGLFFSKARFLGFLLNSNRKALAIRISDNLLSLAAHRETFEFVGAPTPYLKSSRSPLLVDQLKR
jgi:hypothetical protein